MANDRHQQVAHAGGEHVRVTECVLADPRSSAVRAAGVIIRADIARSAVHWFKYDLARVHSPRLSCGRAALERRSQPARIAAPRCGGRWLIRPASGARQDSVESERSLSHLDGARIGLALSGGGFRAAAFHVGVLMRLEELGILQRLSYVSAVSGGAITAAVYGMLDEDANCRGGRTRATELYELLRHRMSTNLRGQAFFGTPLAAARTLLSFAIPGVQRAPLFVNALERAFFGGARLSTMPPWLVINATNLRTGKAWKFTREHCGDYAAGVIPSAGLTLAQAVGASAAYPGLVDAYPLRTRWELMRQPDGGSPWWPALSDVQQVEAERWNRRFAERHGPTVFPLVDGGVYDNEGVTSLRSAGATHVIMSCSAPAPADFQGGPFVRELLRSVGILHGRLGNANRAAALESTHAAHPDAVASALDATAESVLAVAQTLADEPAARLTAAAECLRALRGVAWPPRGGQLSGLAQIVLHRLDVATDRWAKVSPGAYSIPDRYRGLPPTLLEELSRVRTDLDALEPELFDLLAAQGYAMADGYLKASMPDLVCVSAGVTRPEELPWRWPVAIDALAAACRREEECRQWLRPHAARIAPIGRCATRSERRWLRASFAAGAVLAVLLAPMLAALTVVRAVVRVCARPWRAATATW